MTLMVSHNDSFVTLSPLCPPVTIANAPLCCHHQAWIVTIVTWNIKLEDLILKTNAHSLSILFPIESSLIFRTSHTRHRQQMCKCIMNRMQCNDQWFKINQKRNLWEWQYFSLVFSKFWRISVTSLGQQQLLLWFKIKWKDSSILDFIFIFFRWLEILRRIDNWYGSICLLCYSNRNISDLWLWLWPK